MPIHDWPEQERPREKLIARGPTALSDAELLALFLGSGFGGRDAVQTARDLLQAHGPLRVLLDRPAAELARLPGLVAHVHEEKTRQKTMRRIDPVNHSYDGPTARHLPPKS